MALIRIPYGLERTLDQEIDDRNLVLNTDNPFPGEIPDLNRAVLEALDRPVAGEGFSERLDRAHRVLILIDNWARLTPAHKILPPILKRIRDQGKAVEILVANGLLTEMTETEIRRKLGDEILASSIPVFQYKGRESWDYVFVGVTS